MPVAMSFWFSRRSQNGKARIYALEGVNAIITAVLLGVAALVWLFVVVVERFIK